LYILILTTVGTKACNYFAIMCSLYMISVSEGYSLMGFIKDIPPLKCDNYTEWKKKINLAFVLAEVDWVVTTPCPTEPVVPVREANEFDADWQKRERDHVPE
jgi:hypothetical protein